MKEKIEELINQLTDNINKYYKSANEEELEEFLKEIDIERLVNFLIHTSINDEIELKLIETVITVLQILFNNHGEETLITNDVYDQLYAKYLAYGGQDIVGAKGVDDTVKHKYPMLRGTINKIYYIEESDRKLNDKNRRSLVNEIATWNNRVDLTKYNRGCKLSLKRDGGSAIFECDAHGRIKKVLSRGFTANNTAKDLTKYFDKNSLMKFKYAIGLDPKKEAKGIEFGVKCEIIMTDQDYKKATKIFPFKTNLSAVSGILNTVDPDPRLLKYLTIVPLQYQYEDQEYPNVVFYDEYRVDIDSIYDFDAIRDAITYLQRMAYDNGIPADGVVIRLEDKELQKALGRDNSINRFETAYKFPPEEMKTILQDVIFTVGDLGNISAVAKVRPILFKCQKTVKSINIGSIDRFISMNLSIGDEVIIRYSVVPYIYVDETCKKSDNPIIEAPSVCPLCGEKLVIDPILKCNNLNCKGRKVGRIVNYLNKLNILNISYATVTLLLNHNFINDIEDLYKLRKYKSSIAELPGMGALMVELIIASIDERKSIYDYELLGSLGIQGMGRRKFQDLMTHFTIKELIDIADKRDFDAIKKLKGFQTKTAEAIIYGIELNKHTIYELMNYLKINRNNKVYEFSVCFSNVRDHDFEEYLESKNIKVEDSFKKDIKYLIVDSLDSDSSKIKRAKKIDTISIITLGGAYKLFKYNNL